MRSPTSGRGKSLRELERCEAEQREIENRTDDAPLWLKALGWADWEAEKRLIEAEKRLI
jgi:hypothetical protein